MVMERNETERKGRKMRTRSILCAFAVTGLCAFGGASADEVNGSYDWEDGSSVLGQFDDGATFVCENSSEQAHGGSSSLKLTESVLGGTPQAYVAFIENLEDGDEITASFWVYDTTPGGSPSGRIWGHYADTGDVNSYRGSAGGNSTYSDGSGWSQLSHTWTFVAGDPIRDALVVEARLYSVADGDFIYVDDIDVTVQSASGNATISFPAPEACLELAVENLVAGQTATWTVSNAFPTETVAVVYGFAGGSTNGSAFGYCYEFDIQGVNQNRLIGQGVADGGGVATVMKNLPGNSSGISVKFQAAEKNTCPDTCMSNLLEEVIG
jgi:hypothetical protein